MFLIPNKIKQREATRGSHLIKKRKNETNEESSTSQRITLSAEGSLSNRPSMVRRRDTKVTTSAHKEEVKETTDIGILFAAQAPNYIDQETQGRERQTPGRYRVPPLLLRA